MSEYVWSISAATATGRAFSGSPPQAAQNASTSTPQTIVPVRGRRWSFGRSVAAVELAELGQLSDQGGAGHRTDAFGRAQQLVQLDVVRLDVFDHLGLDVVELLADGLDHGFDAWAHRRDGQLQALALGHQHGQQLAPARDQGGQNLLIGIGQRAQQLGEIVATHQHAGELGEHARVDGVGLGQAAHGLGEVTRLAWVDHRHGQTRRLQRAGQRSLVAAGGLHHHQRHTQRLQRRGQRRMPIGIVVKTSGAELRAQHRDIDVRLGHVDAHHH